MMHKEDASGLLHELVLADFILCLFAPRGSLLVRGTSVVNQQGFRFPFVLQALLSLLLLPSLARHLLAIKVFLCDVWLPDRLIFSLPVRQVSAVVQFM
ncbi:uncharacterized protein [Aegilops tauschii subsp. strangulata]|uniref:uncharacterized protein isoform X5 n=1 Tax=Aegilops tauschii subsp. strangulata TaxID=200361 RepID=UPI003CC83C96